MPFCDVCNKSAQFTCAGCNGVHYCSAQCQRKAWSGHSKLCSATAGAAKIGLLDEDGREVKRSRVEPERKNSTDFDREFNLFTDVFDRLETAAQTTNNTVGQIRDNGAKLTPTGRAEHRASVPHWGDEHVLTDVSAVFTSEFFVDLMLDENQQNKDLAMSYNLEIRDALGVQGEPKQWITAERLLAIAQKVAQSGESQRAMHVLTFNHSASEFFVNGATPTDKYNRETSGHQFVLLQWGLQFRLIQSVPGKYTVQRWMGRMYAAAAAAAAAAEAAFLASAAADQAPVGILSLAKVTEIINAYVSAATMGTVPAASLLGLAKEDLVAQSAYDGTPFELQVRTFELDG